MRNRMSKIVVLIAVMALMAVTFSSCDYLEESKDLIEGSVSNLTAEELDPESSLEVKYDVVDPFDEGDNTHYAIIENISDSDIQSSVVGAAGFDENGELVQLPLEERKAKNDGLRFDLPYLRPGERAVILFSANSMWKGKASKIEYGFDSVKAGDGGGQPVIATNVEYDYSEYVCYVTLKNVSDKDFTWYDDLDQYLGEETAPSMFAAIKDGDGNVTLDQLFLPPALADEYAEGITIAPGEEEKIPFSVRDPYADMDVFIAWWPIS